ncbi:MAG: zf-HC2 domain-containing protein [Acidimicrobiia bacterium]|nr:zf-HC2 domain-containing protein [Acidimicrobiia bacterium]
MECHDAKMWISARVDGEPGDDAQRVDEHIANCPDCAVFAGGAHRLKRIMAFQPVRSEPLDLAPLVLNRAGAPNLGSAEWKRTLLAATGVTLLVLSIPGVLFGSTVLGADLGATDHSGRHLGAFGAALAFGFLYTAWRPERAIGLVPLTSALGALILLTGIIDTARGSAAGLAEAGHLLELVGVTMVWEISGGRRRLLRIPGPAAFR